MSYLDNVARPAVNATQQLYCMKCGTAFGMRTGGGSVIGADTDDEIEARIEIHMEFHDRVDRIEADIAELIDHAFGEP